LVRSGASVTLLECDLRRPTFARALELSDFVSTGQVLAGGAELSASLTPVSVAGCELSLLAARPSATAPAPRLPQARVEEMIAAARESADFVVVDSPPIDAVADALVFARCVDEILLVVRVGRSRLDRLRDAVARIEHSGAAVTGVVMVGAGPEPASYRAYLEGRETAIVRGARS
jgi:Mrp family chromosome partitioning ATPase